MSLLRFLGIASNDGDAGHDENDTTRKIAAHLDHLPADSARFLATFACVLGRVANADLRVDSCELDEMQSAVQRFASLGEREAGVVVEIATARIQEFVGTEGYVATREFRKLSSRDDRIRLLRCLYAVAAADGTISTEESSEISSIGEELGFARPEIMGLRAAWKDKLAEFQNLGRT